MQPRVEEKVYLKPCDADCEMQVLRYNQWVAVDEFPIEYGHSYTLRHRHHAGDGWAESLPFVPRKSPVPH